MRIATVFAHGFALAIFCLGATVASARLAEPGQLGARLALSDNAAQDQAPPKPLAESGEKKSMNLNDSNRACDGGSTYDGSCTSCMAGGCGGGLLGSCNLGAPWTMPQVGLLQALGFKTGGWIQQGITFNTDDPHDSFNGPVATNDLDSEYEMNQLWLYLDKPADNGGDGWALGAHLDMIYGTDWRFGINHGLDDRINGFNRQTYGLVIPQADVEVAYNKLSVKLGHYAGILDYEAVPAVMNPFYSHSYSYGYTDYS